MEGPVAVIQFTAGPIPPAPVLPSALTVYQNAFDAVTAFVAIVTADRATRSDLPRHEIEQRTWEEFGSQAEVHEYQANGVLTAIVPCGIVYETPDPE